MITDATSVAIIIYSQRGKKNTRITRLRGYMEKYNFYDKRKRGTNSVLENQSGSNLVSIVGCYKIDISDQMEKGKLKTKDAPETMAWSLSYGSSVTCSRGLKLFSTRVCTSEAKMASGGTVESTQLALIEMTT